MKKNVLIAIICTALFCAVVFIFLSLNKETPIAVSKLDDAITVEMYFSMAALSAALAGLVVGPSLNITSQNNVIRGSGGRSGGTPPQNNIDLESRFLNSTRNFVASCMLSLFGLSSTWITDGVLEYVPEKISSNDDYGIIQMLAGPNYVDVIEVGVAATILIPSIVLLVKGLATFALAFDKSKK